MSLIEFKIFEFKEIYFYQSLINIIVLKFSDIEVNKFK